MKSQCFFYKIILFSKPLLLVTFFVFGCSSSPENLTELLYNLAEINENQRQVELEKWLKEQEEFPIVDNSDVYFLYQEDKDKQVFLVGDMNQWNPRKTQLLRIVGTNYYYIKESYPLDSYFEYNYYVSGEFIADSLNYKKPVSSAHNRSLLILPEYKYPTEILTKRNYAYTKLDSLSLMTKGTLPVDYFVFKHRSSDSSAPIVLFLNAEKYLTDIKANITIENLIYGHSIEPCVAVFISTKIRKSLFDDRFLSIVFNGIVPKVQNFYNLSSNRVILGGSLDDGVTAFYALKNFNERLSAVFAQSFSAGMEDVVKDELENIDLSNINIFYNFGKFERNDSSYSVLDSLLNKTSAQYSYAYYNEGKSNFSLRGHLADALFHFLGNEKNDRY